VDVDLVWLPKASCFCRLLPIRRSNKTTVDSPFYCQGQDREGEEMTNVFFLLSDFSIEKVSTIVLSDVYRLHCLWDLLKIPWP
jgi:hypothetical protein